MQVLFGEPAEHFDLLLGISASRQKIDDAIIAMKSSGGIKDAKPLAIAEAFEDVIALRPDPHFIEYRIDTPANGNGLRRRHESSP